MFDHADGPGFKIHRCALRRLQEGIVILRTKLASRQAEDGGVLRGSAYIELFWCRSLLRVFQETLGDHVFEDSGERIALGQLGRRLEDDLL